MILNLSIFNLFSNVSPYLSKGNAGVNLVFILLMCIDIYNAGVNLVFILLMCIDIYIYTYIYKYISILFFYRKTRGPWDMYEGRVAERKNRCYVIHGGPERRGLPTIQRGTAEAIEFRGGRNSWIAEEYNEGKQRLSNSRGSKGERIADSTKGTDRGYNYMFREIRA